MTNDELLTLHGRLIAGELHFASRIVEAVLPKLVGVVRGSIPELHDRQDAEEASLDALLHYLEAPRRFDPAKAQLTTWLAHIARRRASDIRRRQQRRSGHEAAAAEERQQADEQDAAECPERMLQSLEWSNLRTAYADRLFREPGDRDVFALMSTGEMNPTAHAQALCLPIDRDGLREAERRIERMRGRIRRIGQENGA